MFLIGYKIRSCKDVIKQFIKEVMVKINKKDKQKITEYHQLYQIACVSKMLEQKDLLVLSDECFNELHEMWTLKEQSGINAVKRNRKGWDVRCAMAFGLTATKDRFRISVKKVIKYIVRRAEILGIIPKDKFRFKLSMDA
jgi:hypothetical protein